MATRKGESVCERHHVGLQGKVNVCQRNDMDTRKGECVYERHYVWLQEKVNVSQSTYGYKERLMCVGKATRKGIMYGYMER